MGPDDSPGRGLLDGTAGHSPSRSPAHVSGPSPDHSAVTKTGEDQARSLRQCPVRTTWVASW